MSLWILTSALLILLVIALRRVLRGRLSPEVQYALWALVLLRLLIPGSVAVSPMSVENLPAVQQTRTQVETVSQAYLPRMDYDSALEELTGGLPETEFSPEAWQQAQTAAHDYMRSKVTVQEVLHWVWYGGMAVVTAALVGSNLQFYLRLRRSRKKVDITYKNLAVYVCEGLATPCLFGFFRPPIYITSELETDGERLRHVLAHEYTHCRHGDQWWSLLRDACLVLHWYNPLVWWAAVLSRRDAETACDAGAIRLLGEEARAEYGRTLIGLTVARAGRLELLRCATTMTGGKRAIRERVQLIARKPRMRRILLAAVLCVVFIAAGCAFTEAKKADVPTLEVTPEATAAPTPAPTPAPAIDAPEDTPEPTPEPTPTPVFDPGDSAPEYLRIETNTWNTRYDLTKEERDELWTMLRGIRTEAVSQEIFREESGIPQYMFGVNEVLFRDYEGYCRIRGYDEAANYYELTFYPNDLMADQRGVYRYEAGSVDFDLIRRLCDIPPVRYPKTDRDVQEASAALEAYLTDWGHTVERIWFDEAMCSALLEQQLHAGMNGQPILVSPENAIVLLYEIIRGAVGPYTEQEGELVRDWFAFYVRGSADEPWDFVYTFAYQPQYLH